MKRRGYCVLCLAFALPALRAGSAPPPVDYQEVAKGTRWDWSEEKAKARTAARQVKGEYRAEIQPVPDKTGEIVVRLTKAGQLVYSFSGHSKTVFALEDHILYRAVFDPSRDGCAIVAYDLVNKKQLWKADLRGLGTADHPPCRNAVNLDVAHDMIQVFGNESIGRYFEVLERSTGKTVGHKVFMQKK